MQSTSSELDSPAHIWIIYSDARWLNKGSLFIPGDTQFDGLFVGFSAHLLLHTFQPPWNSPAVSGGVRAIFLAPNHSIPTVWWSLLINHVTMFHNLGITASMSLITICALLKPKGSQSLCLRNGKRLTELHKKQAAFRTLSLERTYCISGLTWTEGSVYFKCCAPHLLLQLQWVSGYQLVIKFDVCAWPQVPQYLLKCQQLISANISSSQNIKYVKSSNELHSIPSIASSLCKRLHIPKTATVCLFMWHCLGLLCWNTDARFTQHKDTVGINQIWKGPSKWF